MPLSIDEDPAVFAAPLDRDIDGLRIAWMGDWNGYLPMEHGILPLCEQTQATFRNLGVEVDAALPDFDPERLWECWLTLRHWGAAGSIGAHYDDPE